MVRPSSCCLSAALPQKSSTISLLTPLQNPSTEAIVIYGWWAPDQKKRLERLAKTKGVQADIGPCSDDELLALYERCDLFIQASTVELEGMSALEAMAMACPVLLNHSKTSALHELPALPDASSQTRTRVSSPIAWISYWIQHPNAAATALTTAQPP